MIDARICVKLTCAKEVVAVAINHSNRQNDDNILHRRPDVLRLNDIIPSSNKQAKKSRDSSKNTNPPHIVKLQDNTVPEFNLAEQIMAEQRKITGVRRRSPGKRIETPEKENEVKSNGYAIEQPPQVLSEQEQIIADIVARDIQKLCRHRTSI